jgi:hypothetical protein
MMDMFDFSRTPNPKLILPTRSCTSLTIAQERLLKRRNPD